jgi:hypothetical protein
MKGPDMKSPAIVLAVLFSFAQASAGAWAADGVVAKSNWIDTMKTLLPNSFCSSKEYFRKCFNVTEDQCIEEAVRATKVCVLSITDQMPAELHLPDDGRNWGGKLGRCVGEAYEISLSKSRIQSGECPAK